MREQDRRELIERFEQEAQSAGALVLYGIDALKELVGQQGFVPTESLRRQRPDVIERAGTPAQPSWSCGSRRSRIDIALGMTRAESAVAQTGSVLLDESHLDDRLVHLMSVRLVVIVQEDTIVDGLAELAPWIEGRGGRASYVSLVTGPSRSADIERSLTVGVQGPRSLELVVV